MGWGGKDLNTDHHRTSAIWIQRQLLVSRESFDDTLTLDFSCKTEADGFCYISCGLSLLCSQGLMMYPDGMGCLTLAQLHSQPSQPTSFRS